MLPTIERILYHKCNTPAELGIFFLNTGELHIFILRRVKIGTRTLVQQRSYNVKLITHYKIHDLHTGSTTTIN
jgi:hypothetical protein